MRDTIDMAREAGATVEVGMAPVFNTHAELNRLVALARADEREECLSVIKPNATPMEIAAAIRARGNT